MPDIKEEEEAATESPHNLPFNDDNNDLYAQPQARLAHHLALDRVAELPSDVQALLVQGVQSIYNDDEEFIKLPEIMECAFCNAIDSKAVAFDAEPKLTTTPCAAKTHQMNRVTSDVGHIGIFNTFRHHLGFCAAATKFAAESTLRCGSPWLRKSTGVCHMRGINCQDPLGHKM
jgi:hypothetical protein